MGERYIDNLYFNWMRQMVCDGQKGSWGRLLRALYDTEFVYQLDMDGNRADDGVDLRYRFGYEMGYSSDKIRDDLDVKPCSILEMMVALAIRCEEHIMDDPDIGNRTGQWFWGMISNLGLGDMDDAHFVPHNVDYVMDRFLKRDYLPDGTGGLFSCERCRLDMRTMEIWHQMMRYLAEYLRYD